MSDTRKFVADNDGYILPFDAKSMQIHYGYGMNAFDSSRRLSSVNREALIDILLELEMLIGSKENSDEKWAQSWESLRENVIALRASEEAECAANIFNNLRFLAPPSEIREIHRG